MLGLWLNWRERWSPKPGVGGSSPSRPEFWIEKDKKRNEERFQNKLVSGTGKGNI